jgi:SAM-dependent methyltransferase
MKALCRGSDRLYGTTEREFQVVECRQCRLIRLSPRPDPKEIQQYYPENYWYDPGADTADKLAETWRRFVLRDHVRFVAQALAKCPKGSRLLDVGCGGGLFLREMNLPQDLAYGLDFSVGAASVAWATNGVPVACGALTKAPFRPGSFGLITMFHVLEHLYDPIAYVTEAADLLAPGGRLVVQVPNANCWQFLLLGEAWNGLDIPRHLIDFKEEDVTKLLEHCGFEVVRRKHFSLRDNPAGLASTLAVGLDPMARRIRKVQESAGVKLLKDFSYFGLLLASIPFAVLEAVCGAGATIMVEARRKA